MIMRLILVSNQISDHQMIFLYANMSLSIKNMNNKYVEVEQYSEERVRLMVNVIE